MLGTDIVMTEMAGFIDGQFDDSFGPGVKPISPVVAFSPRPIINSTAERTLLRVTAQIDQDLGGHTFFFPDKTKQNMLGPDIVMIEVLRFFLG